MWFVYTCLHFGLTMVGRGRCADAQPNMVVLCCFEASWAVPWGIAPWFEIAVCKWPQCGHTRLFKCQAYSYQALKPWLLKILRTRIKSSSIWTNSLPSYSDIIFLTERSFMQPPNVIADSAGYRKVRHDYHRFKPSFTTMLRMYYSRRSLDFRLLFVSHKYRRYQIPHESWHTCRFQNLGDPWSAMTRLPQHLASSLGYQVPVTCVEPRPLDLRRVAMRLRWSAETAARGARTKCIQIWVWTNTY